MKRFIRSVRAIPILAVLCGVTPCRAQQSGTVRTIPLTVVAPDGGIETALKPANFRVKGVQATVISLTLDRRPRRIYLMLDISVNMSQTMIGALPGEMTAGPWNNAKDMAKQFLAALPASDSVSLYVFADEEKQLVPFTHNFAAIVGAISTLPEPDSKEARRLYGRFPDFADSALVALSSNPRQLSIGDYIAVFSDGDFLRTKKASTRKTLRILLSHGGRILLFGSINDMLLPSDLSIRYPEQYARDFVPGSGNVVTERFAVLNDFVRDAASLALETGGTTFELEPQGRYFSVAPGIRGMARPAEILSLMREAALVAQNTYQMRLSLAQPLEKEKKIKIELLDSRGKNVRRAFLLYPRRLEPRPKTSH